MSKTKGKDDLLFGEFHPWSKEDWIEKARADLKGADFDKRLIWKNLNDIEVQPFYVLEERRETLENTGSNSPRVVNYRRIGRRESNKNELAQRALAEGINGILFEVNENDRIDGLLEGLDPKSCAIAYSIGTESTEFVHELKKFYENSTRNKSDIRGYLEIPDLSEFLAHGEMNDTALDRLAEVCRNFEDYPSFKTLVASGKEYADSGANQSQEIAFTLNSIVFLAEEMKQRGLGEKLIFDSLHVVMATGSEYFLEIAKLRSFMSLLHLVAAKYVVQNSAPALMSRSSTWTRSALDPYTNMLRATTETMSALLGNSDAIEIDPYDKETGASKDLSKRIAGNIATILHEESYFGKVRNPVDGSYYIEELTHQLGEKALELFKELEQLGGFKKGMELGVIQNKIALVRTTRLKLISRRKSVLVGVNKYPNLMEKLPRDFAQKEHPIKEENVLRPRRAGLELELVRSNTESLVARTGHRPTVHLAAYGGLAMRKARAGFAFDFLGVGGYSMLDETSYSSALEAAEKSAGSASDIVVICSSDEDYDETALDFVKAFRKINQSSVLLLAGNPVELSERLKSEGLDAFIHLGSDIVDTLNRVHKKITQTGKKPKL